MQLFITSYELQDNQIIIQEDRIIHQLKNVLRASKWYEFLVQSSENSKEKLRYTVKIDEICKNSIICDISDKNVETINSLDRWIVIAMLNKFDKLELIVQKLSEIGIENIVFWPSERSQIREISENKLDRLNKISLEAVEQSKWWILPSISFSTNLDFLNWKNVIVFDWEGDKIEKHGEMHSTYAVVWPEWGFWPSDFKIINKFNPKKYNIWNTIFRAETAAIIWWWILINY